VVPASWDETRVLDGRIGEYVVIARRRGTDWFIGAMTDAPRTVEVPLAFLGAGAFEATVYADVPESATTPTRIGVALAKIAAGPNRRPLVLSLVRGGGAAVQVRPATR
jgi:alpha-glucosidase